MNQKLQERATVLVVDDTPDNLAFISGLLKDKYRIKIANNGEKAVSIARSKTPPDLILLDIMMPEMDGYEVCQILKSDPYTKNIPIIFLTAKSEVEDEHKGLEMGVADYIIKPISPPILLARVKTQLILKASSDFLRDNNQYLEQEVTRRTLEVVALQDATILMLTSLAETRDNETGNHILRTQNYVRTLAQHLKTNTRFEEFLTDHNIYLLYKCAPLHDIGKVGIPDNILLKPGRLTAEEFKIMKTHAILGSNAMMTAEKSLGMKTDFLFIAKEIAHSHHEKWDGTGYPEGLSGDDIPISARLMAIADVYDALISKRVYKEPMTHEEAISIITSGKGLHFDPDMVDAFMEIDHQFNEIALQYTDF